MSQMIESFLQQGPTAGLRARPVELQEAAGTEPGAALMRDAHPLHGVRVKLQVCVGTSEMTLGELLSAREHEVLVLDRAVEQPVDLLLEGKVVARGELVAVDGVFGVRITELPLPLRL
ncbi:FliM/FliN family flagellar motor switch protein [Ramlibacter sp. USB13]|uniref:Flagellar motor switch protein FliN n=1 Tax=Ramlibacter cellulosilyticus TaxID=2764187 RepID=A0A923MWN6_9BURK|nr:FliM/FliN family flagellar motor switch protein [Ramlibacter cellulosilyticus]MBC5785107.1 FliM/FliN family flagellar motor switch protein [Ramlibacter cellulosilyticus]